MSWPHVQDQALRHRVTSLLGRNFERWGMFDDQGPRVPNRDFYRAVGLFHSERNRAILAEMDELVGALDNYRDDVLLRKGAYLVPLVYGDPGLRPMVDIDLLVRPEVARDVARVLAERGYRTDMVGADRRSTKPLTRYIEVFWRMHTNNAPVVSRIVADNPYVEVFAVDVVTALFPPRSQYRLPVADIFDRSGDFRLPSGRAARVMDHVDLLIDLCCHLFKESTTVRYLHRGKHQRLIQYCDIAEVLATGPVCHDELLERAGRYAIAGPIYFALAHLALLHPAAVPSDVLSHLASQVPQPERFLRSYGQVEADEPLVWQDDFMTRMFAERPHLVLPPNRSPV
jgi:Uncharacterised nucleotidyltransferase